MGNTRPGIRAEPSFFHVCQRSPAQEGLHGPVEVLSTETVKQGPQSQGAAMACWSAAFAWLLRSGLDVSL